MTGRVINTTDGEIGFMMNGWESDGTRWNAYEVETVEGIEIWQTDEMLEV